MEKEIAKLPEEEADKILELPNSYFERGMEKGIEEGIVIGEKKGIEKGIEKVKVKIVTNMHKKGFSDELIADISEISLERVKEIINNSSKP